MRSLLTLKKEHEQGFIAYNINSNKKKLTRDNGQSFEIVGKSGLFCKDVGNDTECLPIDQTCIQT